MRKILVLGSVVSLLLFLSACSIFKKSDDAGSTDEIPPISEAATDPVPADSAENPPAVPDQTAQVPDANAAPQTDLNAPQAANVDAPPAAPENLAAAAPAPTPDKPAATDTGNGGFENYTVQKGDTLMKIAFENYGDLYQWKKIYDTNREVLKTPNHIPPGTVIKLEKPTSPTMVERNGEQYLIKQGDTLGTISDDVYGTKRKWRKLWENNKQLIHDPNRIFAGFLLYYTMTPEERREAEELKKQKGENPLANNGATPGNVTAQPEAPQAPVQEAPQAQAPSQPQGQAPVQPPAASDRAPTSDPNNVQQQQAPQPPNG